MTRYRVWKIWFATLPGVAGVCLLVIVLCAPHTGHDEGQSFFTGAVASAWGEFDDWPAAWCSLKMVLLCLAAFLVIESVGRVFELRQQHDLATVVFLSALVPFLGLLVSGFFLVRALL